LPSSDSALPSGVVPHNRSMRDLLLEMEPLDCSGWLLGQEGKLPDCSDAGTDFLPAGCFDGTATAEETASGAGARADADAGDLEGDLA
jgi:hypothetical protein